MQKAKWTVAVLALLAGLLWSGKGLYDHGLKQRALERHAQLLRTAKTLIHDHLLNVVQDSHQLALTSAVQDYTDAPSAANRARLERILTNTSDVYGRYDQIRYTDLDGMERVRVNYAEKGAYSVADAALQSKADRYYIQQGRKLDAGQVYLSPLDLNVEQGEVEQPLKPVLRLVRKVANSQGKEGGLLVLNYSAARLLNQFRAHFPAMDRAMLLNHEGYWLLNHRRENEWGWQLGQPGKTLSKWRPGLWEQIQATPEGSVELDGNLFSYRRFDIASFNHGIARGDYVNDLGLVSDIRAGEWTMLVETAKAQWQAGALYMKPWFQAFIAGLFAMAVMLVYFVIASREQRRVSRAAQRDQLADFKDLYENAPIGYVTVSAAGLVTNVNHVLLAYLGYQREELLNGCYFMDLVDDESRAGLEGLMHSLGAGEHEQYRLAMRCKHGEQLTVLCSVSSRLSTSSTLTVGRCSVQDISQQVSLERSLERLAYSDALTGLANRRHFDELASREIKRLQREGGPLTALALDVDHFKAVNDRYGHDAGDEVLKSLARHGEQLLRGTDILARFGGEEFTVLLPGATQEQGRNKAEALRKALAAAPVTLEAGEAIHYTVSIGVATLARSEEAQLPALLKRADEALYQAKRSGRNRVCVEKSAC